MEFRLFEERLVCLKRSLEGSFEEYACYECSGDIDLAQRAECDRCCFGFKCMRNKYVRSEHTVGDVRTGKMSLEPLMDCFLNAVKFRGYERYVAGCYEGEEHFSRSFSRMFPHYEFQCDKKEKRSSYDLLRDVLLDDFSRLFVSVIDAPGPEEHEDGFVACAKTSLYFLPMRLVSIDALCKKMMVRGTTDLVGFLPFFSGDEFSSFIVGDVSCDEDEYRVKTSSGMSWGYKRGFYEQYLCDLDIDVGGYRFHYRVAKKFGGVFSFVITALPKPDSPPPYEREETVTVVGRHVVVATDSLIDCGDYDVVTGDELVEGLAGTLADNIRGVIEDIEKYNENRVVVVLREVYGSILDKYDVVQSGLVGNTSLVGAIVVETVDKDLLHSILDRSLVVGADVVDPGYCYKNMVRESSRYKFDGADLGPLVDRGVVSFMAKTFCREDYARVVYQLTEGVYHIEPGDVTCGYELFLMMLIAYSLSGSDGHCWLVFFKEEIHADLKKYPPVVSARALVKLMKKYRGYWVDKNISFKIKKRSGLLVLHWQVTEGRGGFSSIKKPPEWYADLVASQVFSPCIQSGDDEDVDYTVTKDGNHVLIGFESGWVCTDCGYIFSEISQCSYHCCSHLDSGCEVD